MARKKETPLETQPTEEEEDKAGIGDTGSEVHVRLTRRSPYQPSPRLPDYLLEDELNRLMDPREWKVYRALWRHSIGLRRTPLITAGYADIADLTGLSRPSVIRALKSLMKKRYLIRIIGPGAKGETREEQARIPGRPREGHRYLVCSYREILESRLRDGTPLKEIPEGGLYPEEIEVFRREEQESLFTR